MQKLSSKQTFRFQKHCILSGSFPKCPETFQIPETFQRFRKVFQSVRKLSRVSINFPGNQEISEVSRNFPERNLKKKSLYLYITTQKHSRLQKLSLKKCVNACKVCLTLVAAKFTSFLKNNLLNQESLLSGSYTKRKAFFHL